MTFEDLIQRIRAGDCIRCRTRKERYEVLRFLASNDLHTYITLSFWSPDNAGREGVFHPYIGLSRRDPNDGLGCFYTISDGGNVIPYKEVKALIENRKTVDREEFERAFAELIGEASV